MAGSTSGVLFTKRGDDVDMKMFQGATINFTLTWGGGTPIDVTGYDARMQIRPSASDDGTPIAEFTVGNGRVTIGDSDGLITFSMTDADSDDLVPGEYVYDIEVLDDAGTPNVHRAMSGCCEIVAEVTK